MSNYRLIKYYTRLKDSRMLYNTVFGSMNHKCRMQQQLNKKEKIVNLCLEDLHQSMFQQIF